MTEKRIVLAVGRFIRLKGFDVLIRAAARLSPETGVYIIGGKTPEEYLALCSSLGVRNVHFLDFKPKEQLQAYWTAADVFAMPTRGDAWGLVVSEAMSFGLPVVSTDRCGAALELVEDGVNGRIVPVGDADALAGALIGLLNGDLPKMADEAAKAVAPCSIENMVRAHMDFFARPAAEK